MLKKALVTAKKAMVSKPGKLKRLLLSKITRKAFKRFNTTSNQKTGFWG